MAITFERKTEEELQKEQRQASLIPKDTIMDFLIVPEVTWGENTYKTEERISSTNKPQFLLVVQLLDRDGNIKTTITDYITMGNNFATFKINRLAGLAGLTGDKISANDLINLMGRCKVGIQKGGAKEDGGFYPDKNTIVEYLSDNLSISNPEIDDEIPL